MNNHPVTTHHIERRDWKLAVVAGMASYLDSGIIVSVGISLATWKSVFSLDTWALGVISAALTFSIAIGALFGGRIADVFGRRRVFNIDILIYVVGTALILAASGPTMIIIGVIVAGLAAGADLPTSVAVVSERAPAGTQSRLVASTQVMWSVGIAMTTLLGFAFSTLGAIAPRLLFAHLAIVGVVTWFVRVFGKNFRAMEESTEEESTVVGFKADVALPLKSLLTTKTYVLSIALTAMFYIAWNLMANTLGQFKAYFLVTVSGVTQSTATGFMFATTLLSILGGILFVRFAADTKLRRPLFFVGAILQIGAMAIGALTGGTIFAAMVVLLVIYNLSYPFAGEAIYKVWTQESFPVNARATVQGFTYSLSRFIVGGFALVTPTIVAANPTALLWVLVGCAAASALVGAVIVRRDRAVQFNEPVIDAPVLVPFA